MAARYQDADMNRRKFLGIAGFTIVATRSLAKPLCDNQNFITPDMREYNYKQPILEAAEKEILYVASLAPSGHNTQPWMVKYLEPYHWIIENDKSKWLSAVDPTQRETILSIGAFIQNLEYAAGNLGYTCDFTLLAQNNKDSDIMEVKLKKSGNHPLFDTKKIKLRRTIRTAYLEEPLREEHVAFLKGNEQEHFHFFTNKSKEFQWLNEQTIEANRQQAYRDDAQSELADWIRFRLKMLNNIVTDLQLPVWK